MKVLFVRPMKYAKVIEVEKEMLEETIGGPYEIVKVFGDDAVILAQKDRTDKRPNRGILGKNGYLKSIIVGNFVVAGRNIAMSGEDFVDLREAQIKKYDKMFHEPEGFLKTPHGILHMRGASNFKEGMDFVS